MLGCARYGSDSQSLIFSLKAAVGQDGQGSQLWAEDTQLDWEEGASLLESSTSRTMEELRDMEARQRKTQGSGAAAEIQGRQAGWPLVQSKKGWQVGPLPASLTNAQQDPCTLWCSKGQRKGPTMWRRTRLEIIMPRDNSPAGWEPLSLEGAPRLPLDAAGAGAAGYGGAVDQGAGAQRPGPGL